jgi:hypothetical protein
MKITSKIFGNGKITTYFLFSTGKKVRLKEEEAKELADLLNLNLRCGATKISFIGDKKCSI